MKLEDLKHYKVKKTDLEGRDPVEHCWIDGANFSPRQNMDLSEATETKDRLTDLYGERFHYEIILVDGETE